MLLMYSLSSIVFHLLPTCCVNNTLSQFITSKLRQARRVDDASPTNSTRDRQRSETPAGPRRARESDYLRQRIAFFAAEGERRSLMTPEEKIAENGLQLQRRLEQEPALKLLQQPTPPQHMARARCRAAYCSFAKEEGLPEVEIRDDYRIVLAGQQRKYFHVSCLEKLLELPSLAPSGFKLDSDGYRWNDNWPWTWGLMLRKWFEHSGRIDLKKIAEYITAYDMYDQDEGENFDTQWTTWQLAHQRKCLDGYCECPLAPICLEEPTLKDYKTTEGETCLFSEVLQHPSVEMLASSIRVSGLEIREPH